MIRLVSSEWDKGYGYVLINVKSWSCFVLFVYFLYGSTDLKHGSVPNSSNVPWLVACQILSEYIIFIDFIFMCAEAAVRNLFYRWYLPPWCQSLKAVSVLKPSLSSRERSSQWFCGLVPEPKQSSETGLPRQRHPKQAQTPHNPHIHVSPLLLIRNVREEACYAGWWFRLWRHLQPLFRKFRQEETQEDQQQQQQLSLSGTVQRRWDSQEVHSLRDNQDPTVEGRSRWS